jgi:hypothetical protein
MAGRQLIGVERGELAAQQIGPGWASSSESEGRSTGATDTTRM